MPELRCGQKGPQQEARLARGLATWEGGADSMWFRRSKEPGAEKRGTSSELAPQRALRKARGIRGNGLREGAGYGSRDGSLTVPNSFPWRQSKRGTWRVRGP